MSEVRRYTTSTPCGLDRLRRFVSSRHGVAVLSLDGGLLQEIAARALKTNRMYTISISEYLAALRRRKMFFEFRNRPINPYLIVKQCVGRSSEIRATKNCFRSAGGKLNDRQMIA